MDWLCSYHMACVFCKACPCCIYISGQNSEVKSKLEERVVDGVLVEFRGSVVIKQEMAKLHSYLKC
jgi:hypothetical protein